MTDEQNPTETKSGEEQKTNPEVSQDHANHKEKVEDCEFC